MITNYYNENGKPLQEILNELILIYYYDILTKGE